VRICCCVHYPANVTQPQDSVLLIPYNNGLLARTYEHFHRLCWSCTSQDQLHSVSFRSLRACNPLAYSSNPHMNSYVDSTSEPSKTDSERRRRRTMVSRSFRVPQLSLSASKPLSDCPKNKSKCHRSESNQRRHCHINSPSGSWCSLNQGCELPRQRS